MAIKGQEFHSIVQNVFEDVRGIDEKSQLQVCCPRCQQREGLSHPDGKYNLEINTAGWKGSSIPIFKCWCCSEPKYSGTLGKLIREFGTSIDYEIYKSYVSIYASEFTYDEDDEVEEELNVSLPDEMILFSNMEVGNKEHFEAYNYLVTDRKLSRETILRYRLGFCTSGIYARRIIIPSFNSEGSIDYFVSRSYDPKEKKMKYKNPKADKDKIIFNIGLINFDFTVFLVEGVFDMFSVPNAIPMLGKTISTMLYMKLKEHLPNVVILLDPDAYTNAIDLFYTLQTMYIGCEEKVKIVKLPTNEDVDELRKNKGIDEVIKCLYEARGLTTDDYFVNKLQKPYDKGRGGRDSNSEYFGWESGGTRNYLQ